ncbi:MAG: efflux RND transporter periplasmic adaptor subunit [Candidatus Aminicenantes bacterium]|jgi:cobalt-zinc-cadmium efflux system membrane fusion protein
MRVKFFPVFLIFVLLGIGTSCGKYHRGEEREGAQDQAAVTQDSDRGPGQGRRRQQKAVGRGFRQKAFGQRGQRAWGPDEVIELSKEEIKMIEIQTVRASFKPMRSHQAAMGKVLAHPMKKAIVSYAFSARISQIHVRIGDWVKAGQKLITLQSEEVGTAKSDFYKAMADYELAKVNFEREKSLFDRGVGAKKNYIAAEAELKVAEANLNASEKKLHVLGFSEKQVQAISETHQINPIISLYAPISGKIIENNAVLGAMIDQETEILNIMDPTLLVIDAEIYEKDISQIRIAQDVEVAVPAYPGETFKGKISYISDVLKEETRTITVRTELENKSQKLKPGMFADIKIFLNHQSEALVLPEEAILDEKDEKMIFIKTDRKYYPQIVETGIKEDGYVEILRGIQEGDEVVTKGNYQLKSKLYDEILKKAGIH